MEKERRIVCGSCNNATKHFAWQNSLKVVQGESMKWKNLWIEIDLWPVVYFPDDKVQKWIQKWDTSTYEFKKTKMETN